MTRRLLLVAILGLIATGIGCRSSCGDRGEAFPRLRNAFDRDDDRYAGGGDRGCGTPASLARIPYSTGNAAPVSYPGGGVTYGPVISGPVYTDPGFVPTYPPGNPQPGGNIIRPDNELPAPGGYAQPRGVDSSRSSPLTPIAPKPSGLATGEIKK